MSEWQPPPPPWLTPALGAIGEAEVPGEADNLLIREMHASVDGTPLADEIPWCSAFVAWALRRGGLVLPRGITRAARSWLKADGLVPSDEPCRGAIAVLWRGDPTGWQGHVGFLLGRSPSAVVLLGGNQRNAVSAQAFPSYQVLGYRWHPAFTLGPPL